LKALGPKEFIHKYEFYHDNFTHAVLSGHEVLISGKYVAVYEKELGLLKNLGIE